MMDGVVVVLWRVAFWKKRKGTFRRLALDSVIYIRKQSRVQTLALDWKRNGLNGLRWLDCETLNANALFLSKSVLVS
jgi:hypothetical protein